MTQKLSYSEARKLVEPRIPYVGVSYSSLLKQSSKSVRHTSTQTQFSFPPSNSPVIPSSSTIKKKTRNVCSSDTLPMIACKTLPLCFRATRLRLLSMNVINAKLQRPFALVLLIITGNIKTKRKNVAAFLNKNLLLAACLH